MTDPWADARALLPEEIREWYRTNVTPGVVARDEATDAEGIHREGPLRAFHLAPSGHERRYRIFLVIPVLPDIPGSWLIAHEVAHAVLGHRGSASREEYDQNEREVEILLQAWGLPATY